MHSFAPVSNLKNFVNIYNLFCKICLVFADFAGVPHPGCYFLEPIVQCNSSEVASAAAEEHDEREALHARKGAVPEGTLFFGSLLRFHFVLLH